jgi:hypothetical protein
MVWGHYMHVGGISTQTMAMPSFANWGTMAPAVRSNERDLPRHVLAADEVFFSGGPGFAWDPGGTYRINHPDRRDPGRPAFQNELYGDGHVEGVGRSGYPTALSITNFSMEHYPGGPFFYWRQSP